jgi:hypothetical protein
MTAIELKAELHQLIDGASDTSLLESIRLLLRDKKDASAWRKILTERSRKADEEYAAGLGQDLDDVARELDEEFPG